MIYCQKRKEYVYQLFKNYKQDFGVEPTFEDLLRDCIALNDLSTGYHLCGALEEGWKANNFPETDFRKIHSKILGRTRQYFYEEIMDLLQREGDAEMEISMLQNSEEVLTQDEIIKEHEENTGIASLDTVIWQQLRSDYQNNQIVKGYILEATEDSFKVLLLTPDNLIHITDLESMKSTFKTGILPIKNAFESISSLNQNQIDKFLGKVVSVKITFLEKGQKLILLKLIKN